MLAVAHINTLNLFEFIDEQEIEVPDINSYEFLFELEQGQQSQKLDKKWHELWLKERKLVAAYCSRNVDKLDSLESELWSVRQEMTDIERELSLEVLTL